MENRLFLNSRYIETKVRRAYLFSLKNGPLTLSQIGSKNDTPNRIRILDITDFYYVLDTSIRFQFCFCVECVRTYVGRRGNDGKTIGK